MHIMKNQFSERVHMASPNPANLLLHQKLLISCARIECLGQKAVLQHVYIIEQCADMVLFSVLTSSLSDTIIYECVG